MHHFLGIRKAIPIGIHPIARGGEGMEEAESCELRGEG
jgi:hypothetical protein